MQQVADRAGVSRMTVSRALRNDPDISEQTKARVRHLCQEMGYQPDARISELMSHLRRSRGTRVRETVALIRVKPEVDTGAPFHTEERHIRGCYGRAEELGLSIDRFNWEASKLSVESMIRMLKARGIRGVILQVTGLPPNGIEKLYKQFSVVSLGGELPELNHTHPDHWRGMSLAVQRVAEYGYKRVGLYILPRVLGWTQDLWISAFRYECDRQGLDAFRVRVQGTRCGNYDEAGFLDWVESYEPDAIVSHMPTQDMIQSLESAGYRVPEDIAMATVEWLPDRPQIAGVDQMSENQGRSAVDVTTRQLAYNEKGVPPFAKKLLVQGKWRDGASLPVRG